ncbi:lactonase family protein [Dryocola clanedunensis]|uniref:lactonase family protein n=1 Tax=Cedecea sulfonylureivorans TaxID=3051154 RepID=UPI0019267551|nr:beta-propeller fold lactonase family protein [Cedecea sulfonylureivorans]
MRKYVLSAVFLSVSFAVAAKDITGGVYVATNNAEENSIIGYTQYSDGTLSKIGEFKTGGKGTGLVELFGLPYDPKSGHTFKDGIDPLASAYGLWRSADKKNVLVVNAGDGTVTSLHVQDDLSLKVVNKVAAGDVKPTGIASYKNYVYVVSMGQNADDPAEGNIKGYTIDENGSLKAMPDSVRTLSGRPASVEVTPDGKFLIVVEITTGLVRSYAIGDDGALSAKPVSMIYSPQANKNRFFALPIGTKIVKGENGNATLLVTETRFIDSGRNFYNSTAEQKKKYPFLQRFQGQTGSVTSYNIDTAGKLTMVSPDVLAGKGIWGGEQAVCWVTASEDGKFAWTTNPLTSSISTYSVNNDGSIKLKKEIVYQDAKFNEYFLDMDLSADGNYVNTISGNTGKTFVFKIDKQNGDLTKVGEYPGSALVHSYGLVTVPYQK